MRKAFSIILLAAALATGAAAQNMATADGYLQAFRTQSAGGQATKTAYTSLYNAATAYTAIIGRSSFGSDDFVKSKNALREIFPRLADGAYYFASLNDQESVLRYACAYVDISLIPCMEGEGMQQSSQYAILSNLAATNLYNRRQYEKSILYFQAYLESGDQQSRQTAFEGLGRCFFEQKDYGRAANICYQGAKLYPQNLNILLVGIEACGHNGNDTEMEYMLERALALQPQHRGLLEYQGKLYERQHRYDRAAATFDRLCHIGQPTLDHTCHLAFDYYNAATIEYTRAKANNGGSVATAQQYFRQAAPYLRTVLDNSPYAANVARALAMCYSLTGDGTRLTETNKTLTALHSQTVDMGALPTLVQNYVPSPELNPVSAANTQAIARGEDTLMSDVDMNIPETKLKRKNTYVVIFANEDYEDNEDNPKVEFAKRDGEMFKEYCMKVLGVEKESIRFRVNATKTVMDKEIEDIGKRTNLTPDKVDVILYYAGHGAPEHTSKKAFLIPSDVSTTDLSHCVDLEKMYAALDATKAKSVTVFLDACFSGASRDEGMIASGRYVRKAADDVIPAGKTVVFSAATGKQAALPFKEKGHGYFTYHLLKALQESRGDISLGELAERIKSGVELDAFNHKKEQTPTTQAPRALADTWQSRKL